MTDTTPHKSEKTNGILLPALVPSVLLPERYSVRAQMVTWLKRIDDVQVREAVKRSDGKRYVVEVYMRLSHSHIPTARAPVAGRARASHPDMTTERRFSDFCKLLTDCYYLAHDGHGFMPCTYCVAFVDYVLAGKEAPSVVHKIFHSDTAVCELLTQFVNNLLELTRRVKTYEDHCNCLGKQQAPERMKQFLSGGERDEGTRRRTTIVPADGA